MKYANFFFGVLVGALTANGIMPVGIAIMLVVIVLVLSWVNE